MVSTHPPSDQHTGAPAVQEEAAPVPPSPISPALITALQRIVGEQNVLNKPVQTMVYETDGYTMQRHAPEAVVLPANTEEVSKVVAFLHREGVTFTPRGAGTSLCGSTIALHGGVTVCVSRMNRIVDVDIANERMTVEAGVVNLNVSREVADDGFFFAPDPSSQGACTIGGNIAANAGGPHTLKYGVTINHILGVEMVLPDGQVVRLGHMDGQTPAPGYDLTGFVVGSEGTLGIVTRATLRLTRLPQTHRTMLAVFDSVDDATRSVSDIVGQGIIPAAIEMMDNMIIHAVEAAFGFGFPLDAAAVVIVELDGLEAGIDALAERVASIMTGHGAREIRRATSEQERDDIWKSRKRAFGALGRLSPSYVTQDGVVPRTKLPDILRVVQQTGEKHGLKVANVFHAGDGNIHPVILYDDRDESEIERALLASHDILSACIDMGGSVTGEHGVGIEKIAFMERMYSADDLKAMTDVRAVFNPENRCNPGKIFPTAGGCIEIKRPRRAASA